MSSQYYSVIVILVDYSLTLLLWSLELEEEVGAKVKKGEALNPLTLMLPHNSNL